MMVFSSLITISLSCVFPAHLVALDNNENLLFTKYKKARITDEWTFSFNSVLKQILVMKIN